MQLEELREEKWIRDLDAELVRGLEAVCGGEAEAVRAVLALASAATGSGDVCLPLEEGALRATLERRGAEEGLKRTEEVVATALEGAKGLGGARLAGGGEAGRPFVAEGGRLYLRRYHRYEAELAARLLGLAAGAGAGTAGATAADEAGLNDEQKAALESALESRLTVITGGPGTGKTFVAARLLSILMREAGLSVVAAAPTGKAAARVKESLERAMQGAGGAVEAKTVDRLLGWQEGPYFRHDEKNPLREDVVVVDETSMLDLPKAVKLLRALGEGARLVLLGDRNQLSSVDPGNVMAEICSSKRLQANVRELTVSRRFPAGSDVQILAEAVLKGDVAGALAKLKGGGDLRWHDARGLDVRSRGDFGARLKEGYRGFLEAVEAWKRERTSENAEAVLRALDGYRVLCVTRHGPQGADAANLAAAEVLFPNRGVGENYTGRVVMIRKNRPDIGLYNGDTGVILGDKAWFSMNGTVKDFAPMLLPDHETAFAITVHKSQGSEFDAVEVVLPEEGCAALLRRELVYTAITRTKSVVDFWCTEGAFKAAVERQTERNTGLRERLDGGGGSK